MSSFLVSRFDPFLQVGKVRFEMHDLAAFIDSVIAGHGHRYPDRYRPPIFKTGSPYGEQIIAIGAPNLGDKFPDIRRISNKAGRGQIIEVKPTMGQLTDALIWGRIFHMDPFFHFGRHWVDVNYEF